MPASKRISTFPLVRLNLARPFLNAADEAQGDLSENLLQWGLTSEDFADDDRFVPATTMYEVVEMLGGLTGDAHAGVRLGEQLDPFSWRPLQLAVSESQTIAELLLRFSIDAYREATSVTFNLTTKGERTTFSEERQVLPDVLPCHNDGFGAAYTLTILREAVGEDWKGREVIVEVCDPGVFPAGYHKIRLARSDTRGFKVSFPTEWMLLEPKRKSIGTRRQPPVNLPVPSNQLDSLRVVLSTYLADATLNNEGVARLCGVSSRTLARQLAEQETSVKRELDGLRSSVAKSLLSKDVLSIAEVGMRVGYPDPSVFSRTFKRWTGESPRDFRRRACS